MPRNEEGEFELVLGNKQLLSVFFIVIILMSVCFAMGYIIGRNSAPGGAEIVARNRKEAPALVVDPNAPAGGAASQPGGSSGLAPGQVSVGNDAASAPAQTPAAQAPVATTPTGKPAPAVEEHKAAPVEARKPEPPAPAPEPARAAAGRIVEPTPGQTFLQVLAVARPDAELTVETLAKKGFHAVIAPGPNEKLFRVLVGPLKTQADVAKTRTGLEAVGFKSSYVRKY
jgi:hypothetical protein